MGIHTMVYSGTTGIPGIHKFCTISNYVKFHNLLISRISMVWSIDNLSFLNLKYFGDIIFAYLIFLTLNNRKPTY